MRWILAWASILGLLPLTLRFVLRGDLSAEGAAIVLAAAVIMIALGKNGAKIIAPILGVFFFTKEIVRDDPNSFAAVISSLLSLSIALFGLYVMVAGAFQSHKKQQ